MKINEKKPIRIRVDFEENEPIFKKFNAIKNKTGISANAEVIRYTITKTFDLECDNEGLIES